MHTRNLLISAISAISASSPIASSSPITIATVPNALGRALGASALLLGCAAATAQSAPNYWHSGHGDIGVYLVAEPHGDHFHWHLEHSHWHLDSGSMVNGTALTNGQTYASDQLIGWVQNSLNATAPVAAALGVAAGSTAYRAGNNTYQPNLGFAANDIGFEEDWVGGGLSVTLSGWTLPEGASFALLTNAGTAIFSTFDPAGTGTLQPDPEAPDYNPVGNNSFFIWAGDHSHYAFYFSDPGYYELTFTWSGEHIDEGFLSTGGTYGFQVGAIPEPSQWAMLLGAATGLGVLIVRRRKQAQ